MAANKISYLRAVEEPETGFSYRLVGRVKPEASVQIDFSKIRGPHASAEKNFEELVAQLLAAEFNAEALHGAGGDLGVDSFIGTLHGKITVFQAKYFTGSLSASRRRQIARSLNRAREEHDVRRWVLCIPKNATSSERIWFDGLGEEVEWWGASKLAYLLTKHKGIAERFFPEEVLERRIHALESEVHRLRKELLPSSRLHLGELRRSDFIQYLRAAERLCEFIEEDLRVLLDTNDVLVPIDFCELYVYLNSDPEFVVTLPLIDFCIERSPWQLILPPGTVYELSSFIWDFRETWRSETLLQDIRSSKEAYELVSSFREDPCSNRTFHSYRVFMRRLWGRGLVSTSRAEKLIPLLHNGQLGPVPDALLRVDRSDFEEGVGLFARRRPTNRWLNDIADAANLALVRTSHATTKQPIRLLSSAPSMTDVAERMFPNGNPVRTSRQFALLLRELQQNTASAGRQAVVSDSFHRLREAAERLIHLAREHPGLVSRRESPEDFPDLVQAFRDFAPHYRDTLRPIDRMLEDGLKAIPNGIRESMGWHYEMLRGEAAAVRSFKEAWDRACEELTAIDRVLREDHNAVDIFNTFEDRRLTMRSKRFGRAARPKRKALPNG